MSLRVVAGDPRRVNQGVPLHSGAVRRVGVGDTTQTRHRCTYDLVPLVRDLYEEPKPMLAGTPSPVGIAHPSTVYPCGSVKDVCGHLSPDHPTRSLSGCHR